MLSKPFKLACLGSKIANFCLHNPKTVFVTYHLRAAST